MRTHFLISFVILVALVVGGWLLMRTLSQNPLDAIMRPAVPDTYGGKTPQETLDLFVAALRAGDVELASKYFVPDDTGSREKWVVQLRSSQSQFESLANLIQNARVAESSYPGQQWFKIIDGQNEKLIELVSNGRVWKIESL